MILGVTETGERRGNGRPDLRMMLRALRHRNYKLFFVGQGISLIGTWLTRVATSWLVYRLTDSAAMLGFVAFAGLVPAFLLAPIAGVLVDRWDRRRLLIVTQVLAMIQSLALAALALTNAITIHHIILLSLFQGFINAFDMPGRQSFVIEMVDDREDLGNAIALNSSMFNGARLIGPSIAGVLIASVGEGYCFLIDGISYGAVIVSLLMMRLKRREFAPKKETVLRGLAEGFTTAFGLAPIRAILLLVALTGLVGMPYVVLMPVFARDVLGGGPHTYGFLMAAAGVGALTGALFLASRPSVTGLEKIIPIMGALFGAGLVLFSLSRSLGVSLAVLFITGFGMMVQTAASNTILQTIVDDDKRGRVMSFYTTAFLGMAPFGGLIAGQLAARFGAPVTVLADGCLLMLGAALFARNLPRLRELVRPIYVRKGVIPEVAAGLQAASGLADQPPE